MLFNKWKKSILSKPSLTPLSLYLSLHPLFFVVNIHLSICLSNLSVHSARSHDATSLCLYMVCVMVAITDTEWVTGGERHVERHKEIATQREIGERPTYIKTVVCSERLNHVSWHHDLLRTNSTLNCKWSFEIKIFHFLILSSRIWFHFIYITV